MNQDPTLTLGKFWEQCGEFPDFFADTDAGDLRRREPAYTAACSGDYAPMFQSLARILMGARVDPDEPRDAYSARLHGAYLIMREYVEHDSQLFITPPS